MSFQNGHLHVHCFLTFCSSDQSLLLFKFKMVILNTNLFIFICTLFEYSYTIICMAVVEAQIYYPRKICTSIW